MAETKNCIVCNKQFTTTHAQRICCSKKCGDERHKILKRERYNSLYAHRRMREKITYKKECVTCGRVFETNIPQKITCSAECRTTRDRNMRKTYQRDRRKEKRETKKHRKRQTSELARIEQLAREHGLTYGKYVGLYEYR